MCERFMCMGGMWLEFYVMVCGEVCGESFM